MTPSNPYKRRHLFVFGASVLLMACGRSPQAQEERWLKQFEQQDQARQKAGLPPLTAEQQALRHKFRGVTGGELTVDAFGIKKGVNIFDENGNVFFMASNSSKNGSKQGFGSQFGVPITLRAEWRKEGPEVDGVPQNPFYQEMSRAFGPYIGGVVVASYTTTVAERIPDALLDDLRANGGGLRLKVRLHDDGILVGWDIERRPGFNAQKSREGQYYPPAFSHTGGDFKEMRVAHYIDAKSPCQECVAFARTVKKTPFAVYKDDPNGYITMPSADDLNNQVPEVLARNGYFLTPIGEVYSSYGSGRQLREKGWYIHPKTGERIETDF